LADNQHHPAITGAAYIEDYHDDINRIAGERLEPDGGISVTAGNGYNFHFFTWRDPIDPSDIAGVFSTIQARLVLDDPAGPDDRDQACYLLSMGADYWRNLQATWDSQFTNVGDVAIGRFKLVTGSWQAFNMITLSADKIEQNPPPLE